MSLKETIANVFAQRDDRAVSPVIGVILMVAITVILAAVIGTMVLGMTDSVGQNVQAGANVQFDDTADTISVTWSANQNAENLSVNIYNESSDTVVETYTIENVGESISHSVSANEQYRVVVTAEGADDASTVVVEKSSTFTA